MGRATLLHIYRLSLERASSLAVVYRSSSSSSFNKYIVWPQKMESYYLTNGGRTVWNRVRSKMKEEEKSEGARKDAK